MPDISYTHQVLEQIKVPVTLDGDLAVTILNLISFTAEHDFLGDLIFCDNTEPKLRELFDLLASKVDIENREEE